MPAGICETCRKVWVFDSRRGKKRCPDCHQATRLMTTAEIQEYVRGRKAGLSPPPPEQAPTKFTLRP